MMIVFDADGTLIAGETTDRVSFEAAFREGAGFALEEAFFAGLKEITAKAIVHQALWASDPERRERVERAVCEGYLRRLKEARAANPLSFVAVEGAPALLSHLKAKGVSFAIATGDWRETISFKLEAAGIPFGDVPMTTSSEYYSRAEIIRGAVAKAGGMLADSIYVGDGLWDLRACRELRIPFIGVGSRREKLRGAGAEFTLDNFEPEAFLRVAGAARLAHAAC